MATTPTGLCGTCTQQRIVGNTRGSTFSMCERAKVDPAFPKYPRLPVTSCAGYEPRATAPEPPAR